MNCSQAALRQQALARGMKNSMVGQGWGFAGGNLKPIPVMQNS
jgi:hypothetical protein